MLRYIRSDTVDLFDDSFQTQLDAARNPNTRISTLEKLSESPSILVRRAVAHNPSITEEIAERFTYDYNSDVRVALAENPNISEAVVDLLAFNDTNSLVLERIAEHPNAAATTLNVLSRVGDQEVRIAVAANPNISLATAESLADSGYADICWALSQNPALPEDMRKQLAANRYEDTEFTVYVDYSWRGYEEQLVEHTIIKTIESLGYDCYYAETELNPDWVDDPEVTAVVNIRCDLVLGKRNVAKLTHAIEHAVDDLGYISSVGSFGRYYNDDYGDSK